MYFTTVILIAVVFGGLALYLGFRLLRRFGWFFAWLRGTVGICFVLLAIVIAALAYDLSNYSELLDERPIASLSFQKLDEQKYLATVSYYIDQKPADFEVYGDQWQVDARIVRWTGALGALGAKPGFRLDRLSGRYFALEDERSKPRSVHSLAEPATVIDVWKVLQENGNFFPLIDAIYGSATYLPMADLATYQLSLSHNGLTAHPSNEIAKSAVQQWR